MFKGDDILRILKEVKEKQKKRGFLQSIDLAVNLNLDTSKPENRLNEEVILPNGRGKKVKVAVIAGGELALQAKKSADKVITKEELSDLAKDKKQAKKLAREYEFFIAQADMMPIVGKTIGTVLGPRGKMPKPVPANADIAPFVERLRRTVRLRTKDKPVFHVVVGTEEMEDAKVAENIEAVLHLLERKLEKGYDNIKSVYLKSTMGPSIKIEATP
jgi:large subunit ribosomal protein L1